MIIVSVKIRNKLKTAFSTSNLKFNCIGCYFDLHYCKYPSICIKMSYQYSGSRFKLLTIYNIIKLCQN